MVIKYLTNPAPVDQFNLKHIKGLDKTIQQIQKIL